MTWSRALHFKTWSDTQDARHTLPLLIRRLIRASVPKNAIVDFPASEQVQRPGLDGIVEVENGNQFVPQGKSAWEMGVANDKKGKADEDFAKRTNETPVEVQQETNFVFVTPREWRKKDEWADEKKENCEWKDVLAIDANDLEHWIELCPAVDVWFSTTSGRRPEGLIDLALRWDAVSRIASHRLTPNVLLASRDSLCEQLMGWFNEEPGAVLLQSESAGDVLDYLSALVAENASDSPHLERMFVVDQLTAWRALSISTESLILVVTATLQLNAEDVSEAVAAGHHVLITGSRAAAHMATEFQLPRQETHAISNALESCGFEDATSRSIALACCGSSSVLKRLVTQYPQNNFPEWSSQDHRTDLAPFALLGGWVHVDPEPEQVGPLPSNTTIDLMCIEDFMGISRESLESHVARWCGTEDSLFLRFGSHIVVGSREDAWYLLGSAVTPQMLNRFEDLATLVLEEDNPALDLEVKDRWLANIRGKSHSLSSELRRGILESLVLMAVYPTAGNLALNVNFHATVRKVLSIALPENASWKRWATFDQQLQLFAEADPDFLLSRIEADLSSDNPQIPLLFDNGGTGIFSSSLHCGLLWALEKMAWTPQLLPRVTDILAQLIAIERALPDNMGNRPSASLNGIYLWWLPYTNASVDERVSGLQKLVADHPIVGWEQLTKLLPRGSQSVTHPTSTPRWRDWAVGWSRHKVHNETNKYALRIAALVIEAAADSPQKWAEILDGIFRYSDDVKNAAIKQLKQIASENINQAGRSILWKRMRDLISQHRTHSDAHWTFGKDLLTELSAICDQLEPNDPVVLSEWLFHYHPDLPEIDTTNSYDEYHAQLLTRRTAAIQEITSSQGWEGVERLLDSVPDVNTIGWIIGKNNSLTPEQVGIWELLASDDPNRRQFIASYIAGEFNTRLFHFLSYLRLDEQRPEDAAKALCSVPFERSTWNWIETNLDEAFANEYWKLCRGLVRDGNEADLTFVMNRLLAVCRPFTAADILHMAIGDTDVELDLIYRVLEAGLSTEQNNEGMGLLDSYATQQLIKHLQEHSSDQRPRLARIEWGYLPVLERHSSRVEPATLIRELLTSPSLFVDLLKVVYRGASEDPRDEPLDEFEQRHWRHAHDLLDAFCTVPGIDDDGSINIDALDKWVSEVRSLATQEDRIGVADLQVGRLLSRYSSHDGDTWPDLAICQVMEVTGSEDLLEGFTNGLINGRGVTSRGPTTGGEPERALAAKYRDAADEQQTQFPTLASALRRLAEYYDRYAEREDEEAARRKLER